MRNHIPQSLPIASAGHNFHIIHRSGVTLVEVICGLVLTGTLLVALIQAHSLHARQIRLAHDRLAAVQALDHILITWANREDRQLPGSILPVPNHPDWLCHTQLLPPEPNHPLSVRKLRFEIHRQRSSDHNSKFPLASIEVVVSSAF